MTAWWLGLPPAQAIVECAQHRHRLRWERGHLMALDHGDPEEERALAALGGEPFACIELLDAWERHTADARALVLGTRGPTDLLDIDPDSLAAGVSGRYPGRPQGTARLAYRPLGGAMRIGRGGTSYAIGGPRAGTGRVSQQARSQAELLWLLGLGGGIPDRLLATVAATWARRIGSPTAGLNKARPQLYAALQGRVFAALRPWLGEPGLSAELIMINARQPRSLTRSEDSLRAELPLSWLVEVWSRGLATIYGRFCLAAESRDGKRWTLSTVAPDLGGVEVLTIGLPDA